MSGQLSTEVYELTEGGHIPDDYGIYVAPYDDNGNIAVRVYFQNLPSEVVLEVLATLGESIRRYQNEDEAVQVTYDRRRDGALPDEVEVSTTDEDDAVREAMDYLAREFGVKF